MKNLTFYKLILFFVFFLPQLAWAQTEVSGIITSNTTWTKAGSPYSIIGDIGIASGSTLTVESGVEIIRDGDYTILINGSLSAIGTQNDTIRFISNNSIPGKHFLDFQRTNLGVSQISYAKFDNKATQIQNYLRIGNEREHAQQTPKNSGNLLITNSNFSKTYLLTQGYSTTARLIINHSELNNVYIMGAYPRTEPIILNNSKINNSTINSDSYNDGITLNESTSKNTIFLMGCCGSNFTIQKTILLDCQFGGRGDWGNMDIIKSTLINTPINYPSSTVNISSSIIISNKDNLTTSGEGFGGGGFGGNSSINALVSIGGGIIDKLNISSKDYYALRFNSGNSIITNSSFSTSKNTIYFHDFGTISFNNTNINGSGVFLLYNNSTKSLSLSNTYFDGLNESEINNKIFDYNDDLNKGIITINNNSQQKNLNSPLTPAFNIIKSIKNNSVVLSWTANTESDIAGYKIYYGDYTGYSFSTVIDVGNVTSYTLPADIVIDEPLAVTAYDVDADGTEDQFDGNESWYSLANIRPSTPSTLTGDLGPRRIRLTWTAGSSGSADAYHVYRSTDNVNFTRVASTANLHHVDENLTGYTSYYYKVSAFDSLDLSYENYGLESEHSSTLQLKPTRKIFISKNGNSTNIGSESFPLSSIQGGIDFAITGDSVLVESGTYKENLRVVGKELYLEGINGANQTILEPLQPTSILYIENALASKFNNFTFTKGSSQAAGSAFTEKLSFPVFDKCIFRNNGGSGGIIMTMAGSFTISNSLFYDNNANTLFEFSNSVESAPLILHSTFVNNENLFSNASQVSFVPKFINSIIWSETKPSIDYTGAIDLQSSIFKGTYTANNTNFNQDPKFIDLANKDFRLSNFSPAIGVGVTNNPLPQDINGTARPNPTGSRPDLGAFENASGIGSPLLKSSTVNKKIILEWTIANSFGTKGFKILKGLSATTLELAFTLDSTKTSVEDEVPYGVTYFYAVVSVNQTELESELSNIISATTFAATTLSLPAPNQTKVPLKPQFTWSLVTLASTYQIQISIDSTFTEITELDSAANFQSITLTKPLNQNQTYFLRVRNGDASGWSDWTETRKFQTLISPPQLISVVAGNKKNRLSWTSQDIDRLDSILIYRADEGDDSFKLLKSLGSAMTTYLDSSLNLNLAYQYKIIGRNFQSIESEFSNTLSGTPFNVPPVAVALESKSFSNAGEFNSVRVVYSANGSTDQDGEIKKYEWYLNDSLSTISDPLLVHFYPQGTTDVKLVITDDDGGKDSVSTQVSVSTFKKRLNGGIFGGLTAVNKDRIYVADSYLDPNNGAKVQIINRAGESQFDLVVGNRIFTTPSVTSDSSVFITSGTNLNGFNKGGAPLWATLPLGGNSRVTPSIDEISNRIYLGVSNSNFFAIDYLTGKVIWNVICDAPIESSAVITSDRKLVFITKIGTMYGFDISTGVAHTVPGWKVNFGEVSLKSVAIDDTNHIIFGTDKGNLYKVKLEENGTITTLWKVPVSTSINSAPVIDSQGFIYIGNEEGVLSKINPSDGAILWKFNAIAPIRSTPAISNFESINFATQIGTVFSLDISGKLRWKYNADSPVSANILYIDNMLYLGTEEGDLIALYDNPISNTTSPNARISNQPINSTPVWATFQGDYRRTGTKKDLTAPLVQAKDYIAQLQANGSVLVAATQLNNGSTDNVGIAEMTLSKSTFTCSDLGANKIIFTAKDASGNTSSTEVTVTVVDEIKPLLKAKSTFTMKLDAEGKATLKWEDIDEGSTDNCSIKDRILSKNSFTCADLGANKIIFTAKDASGNTSSTEVTVTVVDEIKPLLKAKSTFTMKLDAEGKATLKWEDIDEGSTDNCSIKDRILSKTEFTRADGGDNKINYTVTDVSGNSSNLEINIRVDIVLSNPERLAISDSRIKSYPNPVDDYLTIEFGETINFQSIRITDLIDASGKVVNEIILDDLGNSSVGFSTSKLNTGIYFLRLGTQNKLYLIKFIVIH